MIQRRRDELNGDRSNSQSGSQDETAAPSSAPSGPSAAAPHCAVRAVFAELEISVPEIAAIEVGEWLVLGPKSEIKPRLDVNGVTVGHGRVVSVSPIEVDSRSNGAVKNAPDKVPNGGANSKKPERYGLHIDDVDRDGIQELENGE